MRTDFLQNILSIVEEKLNKMVSLTDTIKNAVATNTEDAMIVTPAMGTLVICENILATLKNIFSHSLLFCSITNK